MKTTTEKIMSGQTPMPQFMKNSVDDTPECFCSIASALTINKTLSSTCLPDEIILLVDNNKTLIQIADIVVIDSKPSLTVFDTPFQFHSGPTDSKRPCDFFEDNFAAAIIFHFIFATVTPPWKTMTFACDVSSVSLKIIFHDAKPNTKEGF